VKKQKVKFKIGIIIERIPHSFEVKTVIPAKAGIQKKQKDWIPHQVRNDKLDTLQLCYGGSSLGLKG